jgi:hypothetical protein
MGAILTLRRDGGYFHPIPDDSWTEATYEAVLTVDPRLAPELTAEVTGCIWKALGAVLTHHGRQNVQSLVIEQAAPLMPAVAADWRARAAQAPGQAPGNQARRERAGEGYPAQDGLVFVSQAELAVYQVLVGLQRDSQHYNSFAVLRSGRLCPARRRAVDAGVLPAWPARQAGRLMPGNPPWLVS